MHDRLFAANRCPCNGGRPSEPTASFSSAAQGPVTETLCTRLAPPGGSLHAEENAFLQIAKYGGDGIKGGNLFTSASSCVLCSKKAYQLGIRHIYYIDPYTDIANSHILSFGKYKNQCPQCHLFYGAIGKAYTCLFTQRIAIKDELKILLDAENAKSESKPQKE